MTASPRRSFDVAIVGGGPAGAALAIRVAHAGQSVVVLERTPAWRWRACGVFASPAAVGELRDLGVAEQVIGRIARPIPAMRVETPRKTAFGLTYGAAAGETGAVGFDREALDDALLDLAGAAGAEVLRGHAVEAVDISGGRGGALRSRGPDGPLTVGARTIVGADGIRSVVARQIGVARPARLGRRVGLSWHVADQAGDTIHDARMVVLDGAYCGLAPVPGGRINVGIVLWGRSRLRALAERGADSVAAGILADALGSPDHAPRGVDPIAGAAALGHRVMRRAGPGWLLVGDAAGFLDPFTGEGIHRALVSARLAAEVIGRPGSQLDHAAYDRAMRQRFGTKDVLSFVVQAFLAQPPLFEYAARRLAGRRRTRETMGLVMGDLLPAGRALDPRFLATLLAPCGRVRSTIGIDIDAPPGVVFALAADVTHWERLLPHYGRSRAERRHADASVTCRFVARRPLLAVLGLGFPVAWRSRVSADAARRQLRFRHIGGATAGMAVTWHIEPRSGGGTHVEIEHDFERGPGDLLPWLVERVFTRPIAGRTLETFKVLAEALQAAAQEIP